VLHQRARGLMWLEFAKDGALDAKNGWIRELYQRDLQTASEDDRHAAAAMHDARAKETPSPDKSVIRTFRPAGFPLAESPLPPQ
jgi:hypothetical protein